MIESSRKLIAAISTLIRAIFTEIVDNITDGVNQLDIVKVALNVTLLCLLITAFLLSGYILVILALRHAVFITVAGFLIAAAYSIYQKLFDLEDIEEKVNKPTSEDYRMVLLTVKDALKNVAGPLGLSPIQNFTDVSLDPEDMITKHGKVWRMGYGTLKKTAGAMLDTELCQRVIQAQLKNVLYRKNPAGFSDVRFPLGGKFVPIIQVDEVLQDDVYLYVMVVIASKPYFQQKTDWARRETMPTTTDNDDIDF